MNSKAPSYELRAIHEDGASSEAQIIPITDVPWAANAGRRGFLGSGMAVASVLALASGCAQKKPAPTPPRTPLRPDKKGDNVKVKVFNTTTNTWEFMTLPCGAPVPPGAICTCNCVPTTVAAPPRVHRTTTTHSHCTCNKVCTCVPVYR